MSGGHEERLTLFLAEQVAALGGQELFNPEADGVEVMVPLATGRPKYGII